MTRPKPSDLPHQKLSHARHQHARVDDSIRDVTYVLTHWINVGYEPDTAAYLTQITLDHLTERHPS